VKKTTPNYQRERDLIKRGFSRIVGIDEAGMSPIAGCVVAGAVILDKDKTIKGLNDSKLLSPERREELYDKIMDRAVAVGIGVASVELIEEINIYWASRKAMLDAIQMISPAPDYLLIDGNRPLKIDILQESIVKGDIKSRSIAAASIIAKVTRDRIMIELSKEYPMYGWQQNKGYPTPLHKEAVKEYGITPHHRKYFKFVKEYTDGCNSFMRRPGYPAQRNN